MNIYDPGPATKSAYPPPFTTSAPETIRIAAYPEPTPKPRRKCALPECGVMTEHNGGYCCAEHCRRHRRERS